MFVKIKYKISKLRYFQILFCCGLILYVFTNIPNGNYSFVDTEAVYISAYQDPKLHGIIRVVAASKIEPSPTFVCHYASKNGTFFSTRVATFSPFLRRVTVEYDGIFIDCPPSDTEPAFFVAVSLLQSKTKPKLKKLRVIRVPDFERKEPTLAACVCPLFGNGISELHLISWIEINRLLGVQHFVFYNYSIPRRFIPLFKYYSQLDLVQIFDWNLKPLPVAKRGSWPPPQHKLHYYGQIVANNDCLYRLKNRFRFIMFSDLDELLLPSSSKQTLPELLSSIDGYFYHSFGFRGTYVRKDFEEEEDGRNVEFLRYTRRENRILPKSVAPKLIIKSHLQYKIYVHEVGEIYTSFLRMVSPDEGLLFHYKNPPSYLFDSRDEGVRDNRVLQYRDSLIRNIDKSLSAIQRITRNDLEHSDLCLPVIFSEK